MYLCMPTQRDGERDLDKGLDTKRFFKKFIERKLKIFLLQILKCVHLRAFWKVLANAYYKRKTINRFPKSFLHQIMSFYFSVYPLKCPCSVICECIPNESETSSVEKQALSHAASVGQALEVVLLVLSGHLFCTHL